MKKWGPLVILAAAQFVMVLDQAVMNVSISQLVADFDTTVTAYCTPPSGPSEPLFQYATVTMHYVGAQPTSTTTATSAPPSSTTETLQRAPAPAPQPVPAAPVSGDASFTG